MKVEEALALKLLEVVRMPEWVCQIMMDSDYNRAVCLQGIALLKDRGWQSEQFWELIKISGYKENVFQPCAANLDLKEKTTAEIFDLLEKTNYHWAISIPAATALKLDELAEKDLIKLMSKACREEIYKACCPLIDLQSKTEEELWTLLTELNFNCSANVWIAPYLRRQENLFELAKRTSQTDTKNDQLVRQICFQGLGLAQKTENELTKFVKNSEYNPFFCQEAMKFFKRSEYILWLIGVTGYNRPVCEAAIEKLEDDELIMLIINKTNYDHQACCLALPKLKSEKYTMEILEKGKFDQEIRHLAIKFLPLEDKKEDELAELIKKYEFGQHLCAACQPFLGLDKKSDEEMMNFLEKTDYKDGACQLFLPLLKLEEKTEEEIFSFLKKSNFKESVGKVLMEHIRSEEYIFKVAKEAYHTTSFWTEAFANILATKTTEEIMTILKKFFHEKKISLMAIQLMKEEENIMEIIRNSSYNQEIVQAGLNILRTKDKNTLNVRLEEN